jgi:hypothetical protein
MRKLRLNFRQGVTESELIGRVMGPDAWEAYYYVQAVFELPDRTEANLLPLPTSNDDMQFVHDEWGQTRVVFNG